MGKLSGKVALISGGTSGIGAAAARMFQAEGATVVATGSNPETLELARRDLQGVEIVSSDAGDLASIEALVAATTERHGCIDVLFVNAGVGAMGPIDEVTEEGYDRLFAVNAKGAFFLVREVARHMPEGGSIVLLGSISHALGMGDHAAYSASKAAMRSFGRTMASAFARRAIRVNTISPGPVVTPMWGKITGLAGDPLDAMQRSVAAMVPLGRVGRPDEIAAAALFLASDDSAYITGIDLPVDGGWLELGRPMQ